MSANDIVLDRDRDNDVLYIVKKAYEKTKTRNLLVTADITLRVDIVENQVVGLTIEDFSEVFSDI